MNASTNSKNFEYIVDSSQEFDGVCLDYLINGKSSNYGLTLDELIVKHGNPNLTAVSEETFIVNYLDPYYKSLQGPFLEITEDQYYYYLEVLPPLRWNNDVFWVGEAYTGTIYRVVIEYNNKYYSALRDMKTSNQEERKELIDHLSRAV